MAGNGIMTSLAPAKRTTRGMHDSASRPCWTCWGTMVDVRSNKNLEIPKGHRPEKLRVVVVGQLYCVASSRGVKGTCALGKSVDSRDKEEIIHECF